MKWTVFGSNGFIGREIVRQLKQRGDEVFTPEKGSEHFDGDLGHIIYAIGLTADFRYRINETVEAHVCLLSRLLSTCQFSSFLYLSSTRLYQGSSDEVVDETSGIAMTPGLDAVYNASKLLGESLCLAQEKTTVRVARLSNVFAHDMGEQNFLGMVLHGAAKSSVEIQQSALTAKDYIDRDQAVYWLLSIAERGKHRLYNVSSGELTTHQQIADAINSIGNEVVSIVGTENAFQSPVISNERVRDEFPAALSSLVEQIPFLFAAINKNQSKISGVNP